MPGQVYELFKNMDKKTNFNSAEYKTALESSDRNERKSAYQNEFIAYNDNINTLSGLLIGQVKKNVFYSSERGYKSSLDMYLKGCLLYTSKLLVVAIPITIGASVMPLVNMIDNVIVIDRLMVAGYTHTQALKMFGQLTGCLLYTSFCVR